MPRFISFLFAGSKRTLEVIRVTDDRFRWLVTSGFKLDDISETSLGLDNEMFGVNFFETEFVDFFKDILSLLIGKFVTDSAGIIRFLRFITLFLTASFWT